MKNKIRIVSDGTAQGTKVFACGINGEVEIGNITRIELLPIEPGGVLQARLTISRVEVDVLADQVPTL